MSQASLESLVSWANFLEDQAPELVNAHRSVESIYLFYTWETSVSEAKHTWQQKQDSHPVLLSVTGATLSWGGSQ